MGNACTNCSACKGDNGENSEIITVDKSVSDPHWSYWTYFGSGLLMNYYS